MYLSSKRGGPFDKSNGGEFLNAKGVLAPKVRPYVIKI